MDLLHPPEYHHAGAGIQRALPAIEGDGTVFGPGLTEQIVRWTGNG